MIEGIPLPDRDGPFEAGFWATLDHGGLAHQHCAACDSWHFPPRWRCRCGGALSYRPVSGRGQLWSWTVVHPPVLPAFASFAPYIVAIVALAEADDLRMTGPLIVHPDDPINGVQPEQLAIGMPLQAHVRPLAPGLNWPVWRIL